MSLLRSSIFLCFLFSFIQEACSQPTQVPVFISGQEGYHTYRIPALITTKKGTLLAFCEGRKSNRSDAGNIDLLVKRSADNGKSWDKIQVVWDDGDHTCGNPCPVIDQKTGTIFLLVTHNLGSDTEAKLVSGKSKGARTIWMSKSNDDGVTWSKPTEITNDVKKPEWTWYATGPGVGIQAKNGRLIIPCDSKSKQGKVRESHVIFSDDSGKSWKLGGIIGPDCNESQIVELTDGSLMMNMRTFRGNNRRLVAISKDGGETFSEPKEDTTLIEPVCQASIERLPGKIPALLFSNPASTKREKMTVRLSIDEGKTWPHSKVLFEGASAYSCLTILADNTIGCLFEHGEKNPYEEITFAHFSRKWLEEK